MGKSDLDYSTIVLLLQKYILFQNFDYNYFFVFLLDTKYEFMLYKIYTPSAQKAQFGSKTAIFTGFPDGLYCNLVWYKKSTKM